MKRAAAAAVLATVALARVARGQPCCAGATALTPARLALHEDALVGVSTRATDITGSFDASRRYVGAQNGDVELDLEQDVLGAIRFFKRAQASVLVPIDATYRRAGATREWGGGVGDVTLALRYDFLEAGQSKVVPGLALLLSSVLPTGRATEDATTPLATGATGQGSLQLAGGAAAEQTFGPFLVTATGSVGYRAARTVGERHVAPGPTLQGVIAAAYTSDPGFVFGLSLVYTTELAGSATVAGVPVDASSGTAKTRLAASGGQALSNQWRAQGAFFWDLPVRGLGESEPIGMGVFFTLIRAWTFS